MRPTAIRLMKLRLLTKGEAEKSGLPHVLRATTSPPRLSQKARSTEKSVVDKLTESMMAGKGSTWPGNLRLEKAEKKTLFWKIPKDERTQLKKILREA